MYFLLSGKNEAGELSEVLTIESVCVCDSEMRGWSARAGPCRIKLRRVRRGGRCVTAGRRTFFAVS